MTAEVLALLARMLNTFVSFLYRGDVLLQYLGFIVESTGQRLDDRIKFDLAGRFGECSAKYGIGKRPADNVHGDLLRRE